jgi:methylated-DNA-protein-cysteine methyltransferase-like protein
MSVFKQKVVEIVNEIPVGKVASYGQIAAYIGAPRAARQVGWILRQLGSGKNIPWWRVINKNGIISINGNLEADRELQKKLLESEKIEVKGFQVDLKKYQFIANSKLLKKLQLEDNYIETLLSKYNI